jgi:hypothetical protein
LTPFRFGTGHIYRTAALLALASFLTACGGSSSSSTGISTGPTQQNGPNAVVNGASLAAATSHWVSNSCHVQVELTTDNGFYSVVVDNLGHTSSGPEKWAIGANANSITIGPGNSGLGGFFWVSALGNIAGSTTSQSFTANVSVTTNTTSQNLGICTFALAQKSLP